MSPFPLIPLINPQPLQTKAHFADKKFTRRIFTNEIEKIKGKKRPRADLRPTLPYIHEALACAICALSWHRAAPIYPAAALASSFIYKGKFSPQAVLNAESAIDVSFYRFSARRGWLLWGCAYFLVHFVFHCWRSIYTWAVGVDRWFVGVTCSIKKFFTSSCLFLM